VRKNKKTSPDADTPFVRSSSAAEDQVAGHARINSETAKIAWQELQRFFAQGYAVRVAFDLDLVDVAWEMSQDNHDQVNRWMESGLLGQVTDAEAIQWMTADAMMWCVVVRPWILVQPVTTES